MGKREKYVRRQLENGLCYKGCGNSTVGGKKTCDACIAKAKQNKERAELRAKWRLQKAAQQARKKSVLNTQKAGKR